MSFQRATIFPTKCQAKGRNKVGGGSHQPDSTWRNDILFSQQVGFDFYHVKMKAYVSDLLKAMWHDSPKMFFRTGVLSQEGLNLRNWDLIVSFKGLWILPFDTSDVFGGFIIVQYDLKDQKTCKKQKVAYGW